MMKELHTAIEEIAESHQDLILDPEGLRDVNNTHMARDLMGLVMSRTRFHWELLWDSEADCITDAGQEIAEMIWDAVDPEDEKADFYAGLLDDQLEYRGEDLEQDCGEYDE